MSGRRCAALLLLSTGVIADAFIGAAAVIEHRASHVPSMCSWSNAPLGLRRSLPEKVLCGVCAHMHVYICTYMYVQMYVYGFIRMCICMFMCVSLCVYVRVTA